jgi:serine/threonine protein phosphatase PrpC
VLAEIDRQLGDDPRAGETTLVVVAVWSEGLAGASVGDSVAYLIGDQLHDVTCRQQRKPLLGSGAAHSVPFHVPFMGGTLLVASDGLWKYTDPAAISRCAGSPDLGDAATGLVDLVRLTSGALWDDVAVVLCRATSADGTPGQA